MQLNDLQIEYMYELVSRAGVAMRYANHFARHADTGTMKVYLLHELSACTCTNNGDTCKRCTRLELINKF